MFRASLERIKGILWFNVHLGLINPGGPGMFLLKRVGLIHPNTDVSCQLGTHWSRAGSQVFAQLTFVAPVLAIFPWLGPEAGDPMEVEPLSPTGSGGWGRDLGGWGSSQLDRFIFFGGEGMSLMAAHLFGILFWGWFWRGGTRPDSNQWGLELEGGQQQIKSGHGPRKVAEVTFCAFDLCFSSRWYIAIAGEAMRKVEQFRHGIYYQIGNILTAFPFNAIAFSTIYLLMMPLTARFLQNFDVANFQRLNWPGWCLQHGWDHSMISYCKL